MKFHSDHTLPTAPDSVFVFGSNLNGAHVGGAARVAAEQFGASEGVATGAWGFSYAIPTLDRRFRPLPLETIKEFIVDFVADATKDLTTEYFITRIGCGIAGFKDSQIAPLFNGAPDNCNFPDNWEAFLK